MLLTLSLLKSVVQANKSRSCLIAWMKITFLGACRQVGRSQMQVACGNLSLLLDAGTTTFKGARFPLQPARSPDACILSHCHLDHSGFLPLYYDNGRFPWLSTFPTAPLTNLLWEDMISVLRQRGETPYLSERQIKAANKHGVCLPYREPYEFFDGTVATLFDAGHIIGSAQTLVENNSCSILYTGDLNYSQTRMHDKAEVPLKGVGALVIESTYANRDHAPRKQMEEEFVDFVEEVAEGGNALVPCFAVGRTQEILMVLDAHGVKANVWVDGMGQKTCGIAADFSSYVRDAKAMMKAFSRARFVQDAAQRKQIASGKGNVIITTAGMLDGGPVLSYLQRMNAAGKGGVLLTGFQVKGTKGAELLEKGIVRDRGKPIKIGLPVKHFDFSAHCGKTELMEFVKKVSPQKVFCVHGDEPTCLEFVSDLNGEGFDAAAPQAGESFEVA